MQNENQRNDILHLEGKLKSYGKQTSELQAEQKKTFRIIDELTTKVEKCGKIVEMNPWSSEETRNGEFVNDFNCKNMNAGIQRRSSGIFIFILTHLKV